MSAYLVESSLLQSELARGTVGTLMKINKVIQKAKGDKNMVLTIRGFTGDGVVI